MIPIHEICGKDELRPTYQCIKIQDGYAHATDGMVAVIMPAKYIFAERFEGRDPFYIPADDFKRAKAYSARRFEIRNGILHALDGKDRITGVMRIIDAEKFQEDFGNFPDIRAVLPTGAPVPVSTISISAELLLRVQKCLEAIPDSLTNIAFFGPDKPVIVTTPKCSDAVGLVMPRLIQQDEDL